MVETHVGSVIGGRYTIIDKLGEGGMSIVWLSRDTRLEKLWAIKEIKANASDATHRADVDLMRKEANIMKNLDHPNIVHVVDIIDENDALYVVMDYVPGKDLAKTMRENRKARNGAVYAYPQEDVIDWGIQLCDALGYLHSQKPAVIYRDMKPGNVMLQDDGSVKIIDFGIAREFKANQSLDTTPLGTRGYASPEAAEKVSQTDARSDIYSLGVTLFHLVTGHSPMEYLTQPNLPPIRQLDPSLSPALEQSIIRATQWNPALRQQTMNELRYELENPVEPAEYLRMRSRLSTFRNLLLLGCMCLVLSLVCLGGSIWAKGKSNEGLMNSASAAFLAGNYEEAENLYLQAIAADPTNIDPYLALVKDVYPADELFSTAEVRNWRAIMRTNRSSIERNDRFGEMCFEAGNDYFYYLETSDPLKRGAEAVASYDDAYNHYTQANDENFSAAASSSANMLSYIGNFSKFIDTVQQKTVTGEDLQEAYGDYYTSLHDIFNTEQQVSPIVRLRLDEVIVNALGFSKYVKGFKASGVSEEQLSELLDSALADAIDQFELVEASETADRIFNGYTDDNGVTHKSITELYDSSKNTVSATYHNTASKYLEKQHAIPEQDEGEANN